jgi:ComF family protein
MRVEGSSLEQAHVVAENTPQTTQSRSTARFFAEAWRLALDLLYPPRCALCHKHGSFLCDPCRLDLPKADGPRCRVCWLPWDGRFCPACDSHPLALDAIRSPFRYESGVRTLVHQFKFRNFSALAEALAGPMAVVASDSALAADLIVPVPLSGHNQRNRGYNQAGLLAREIGKYLGLPVAEALRRPHSARPQSLTQDAAARRRNVEGVFSLRRGASIESRRVLLVDDVATTGATLDACARALRLAGAEGVSAVTFAREDA